MHPNAGVHITMSYGDSPLGCFFRKKMKKIFLLSFLFTFLSLSIYPQSKGNLNYIKSKSFHCNIFFDGDKWISEELITIENSADKKIIFEIEGFFDKDYKYKNIENTNLIKGYADKDKKTRFFEIEKNEIKEFKIFFIGKNSGKNQKANRLPVERINIIECNNTIRLTKSDYEIINKVETKILELKITNEQIIDMFNEFINPWIVLYDITNEKLKARGFDLKNISSLPFDCDYYYQVTDEGKALLSNNILILVGY